jgi:integrase
MTRPVKAKLATLDQLDGRTVAARQARDTISAIESDLGGAENITTAMRQMHGLRASELASLRWDDIEFTTGKLAVPRAG